MSGQEEISRIKVPLYTKIGYSCGNLGTGVVFEAVTAYMVFYCTVILKIPGIVAGLIVSLSVFLDAIADPVMGYISDNTTSKRFGKRHLYLLTGTFLICFINFFIWIVNPAYGLAVKTIWVAASILLVRLALTVYLTPYSALGAEISTDYHERSSIQSMKTVGFLIGIVIVTVGYLVVFFRKTAEYPKGQMNPAAYPPMGITSCVIILVFGLIAYFTTLKYKTYAKTVLNADGNGDTRGNIRGMVKSILDSFKNKNFASVVKGYMFTNILTALANSFALHVYTFTFDLASSRIAVLLGIQLSMAVFSQPVWVLISKKYDKKPAIISGVGLACFACLVLLVTVIFRQEIPGLFYLLIVISAMLGFASGVMMSMPYSMVADTVDYEESTSGKRSEGAYYGVLTLCYKASQSIAITLLGFFLEAIGFNPDATLQTRSVSTSLGLVVAIGGIIVLAFAALSYKGYFLDRKTVEEFQKSKTLSEAG